MATGTLHHKVIQITEDYFGPAAPRYINKLIINHLDRPPDHLTPEDLPELVKWAQLTMSLLTEDRTVVQEFTQRLSQLDGVKA